MKFGMRKPSLKKSLSARTKGRATRAVKKALIPGYGKKGVAGCIRSGSSTMRCISGPRSACSTCSSRLLPHVWSFRRRL